MDTKHFKLSCWTPEATGNLLNADTVLEDVWMLKIELAGGQKFTISTKDGYSLSIHTDNQINVLPVAANTVELVGMSYGATAFGEPKRKFKIGQFVIVSSMRVKSSLHMRKGIVIGYTFQNMVLVDLDEYDHNPVHFYEDQLELAED